MSGTGPPPWVVEATWWARVGARFLLVSAAVISDPCRAVRITHRVLTTYGKNGA